MESLPPSEKSKRIINYRPLFEIAVGLMLGIAAAGSLPQNGGIVLCAAFLLCAAVHAVLRRRMRLLIFALCVLLGNVLSIVNLPYNIEEGSHTVIGFVEKIEIGDESKEIVLTNVEIDCKRFNKRVLISVKEEFGVSVGDEVELCLRINEVERDSPQYNYYLSRGIGAVSKADYASVLSHDHLPLSRFKSKAASTVRKIAAKLFGETDGTLIASALVGSFDIPERRQKIYQATGTAHLLAISGIHMTIAASIVGMLIPNRFRFAKPVAVIMAILFYLAISEPTVGVQRAAIMSSIAVIFRSMRRCPDSLSALSLAAIVILAINPYAMFSVSFLLSFSAAFGIVVFSPFMTAELEERGLNLASIGIVTTISASVAVAVIQMHFFGTFPVYLILANCFVVPAFTLLLQMSVFCILLCLVLPGVAMILASIPSGLLLLTENFMGLVSRLPYAEIGVVPLPTVCCVIALLMIYFVSDNVLLPKRKKLLPTFVGFVAFASVYGIAILKEFGR